MEEARKKKMLWEELHSLQQQISDMLMVGQKGTMVQNLQQLVLDKVTVGEKVTMGHLAYKKVTTGKSKSHGGKPVNITFGETLLPCSDEGD